MIPPYEPAPIDRYCRLFPPADPTFDLEAMKILGLFMESSQTRIPDAKRRSPLAAGYTYFGQFIDHDLTLDETPFNIAVALASIPAQTINGADGRLNLNQIYGEGPGSVRHGRLYAEDGVSFRLGATRTGRGQEFDLPIDKEEGPLSAEERNPENIILRQLCVMFLKLHNRAVEELPTSIPAMERFQRARNRVCWQYQWLVREDFLSKVTLPKVYQEVIREGHRKIDWQSKGFSIPVEFSQAAFRFGHSMVRAAYALNRTANDVHLEDIFAGPQRFGAIDVANVVDWRMLLNSKRRPAMAIDTTMVPPLFHLPPEQAHHVSDLESAPLPEQLAVRTLQRGASTRLATGEQVARALGYTPLREQALAGGEASWQKLDELGLTGRTPLWYYILLEAEIEQLGASLGTVGSHLVAEVIDGCLKTDPHSYVSCFGSDWKPPAWKTPAGTTLEIRRLVDVAEVTSLVEPVS